MTRLVVRCVGDSFGWSPATPVEYAYGFDGPLPVVHEITRRIVSVGGAENKRVSDMKWMNRHYPREAILVLFEHATREPWK
jgi:hypothetical protein